MRNKFIVLISSILLILGTNTTTVNAQTPLFYLPDTVCTYSLITPRLDNFGGSTFRWAFCPPQLHLPPSGSNIGKDLSTFIVSDLDVKKVDSTYFGFLTNTNGNIVKWWFKDGIDNAPIDSDLGFMGGTMPVNPTGVQLLTDSGISYVFVIGGSNLTNTKLTRYKFGNGINNPVTESMDLGNLGGTLQICKRLWIAKEGNNWIGYTFNNDNNLTRIEFGNSLQNNSPVVTSLGNIGGYFGIVTSLTGYNDNGNWYLFATDRVKQSVIKIALGNSLLNAPIATEYGDMSGRIDIPVGYSVIPSCGGYYGYTISRLGSSITANQFNPDLAADTSNIENLGNAAAMIQPRTSTEFILEGDTYYMFVANLDSSVSRIEYAPCTSSNIAGANTKVPPSWKYLTPGRYTVYLIINEGLPSMRTACEEIVVIESPEVLASNDTMICEGSIIRLEALYQGDYNISWAPNYNMTDSTAQIIDVWPKLSTDYVFNINFGPNCIYNDTVKVAVSRISVDAGADRTIPDGHSIVIGGPNTALGPQFTYRWYPTDFFTSVNNEPIATAKPGHSMTYYLEVKNTDGCIVTDSVNISMTCAELTLPNVFVPDSRNAHTSTFGIDNLQIVKLNYFRIYDRWGKLIFETEDATQRWNGKDTGKDVPSGVYVYEIDGFCISGDRLRKTGNVTLIR